MSNYRWSPTTIVVTIHGDVVVRSEQIHLHKANISRNPLVFTLLDQRCWGGSCNFPAEPILKLIAWLEKNNIKHGKKKHAYWTNLEANIFNLSPCNIQNTARYQLQSWSHTQLTPHLLNHPSSGFAIGSQRSSQLGPMDVLNGLV